MKVLIKSNYIRDGYQVKDKQIEIQKAELKMLDGLKIQYEVIEEKKKNEENNS